MKDNPGFCYEIFKNLAFWSNTDGVSYNPCSFYSGSIDQNKPVDQVWYGHNHKRIIQLVAEGKQVPGCSKCYQEEAAGRKSRRQSSTELYSEFLNDSGIDQNSLGPSGLDYSIGNWCNLKCVICGPQNSSSWLSDYQKMYPKIDIQQFVNRKSNVLEIENDSFLTNIKSLHFHGGGEPLLSTAHVKLLKRIDRVKGLSDVRVFYNTNATVRVDSEVLELWSKCKLIELYFSIDDVGARFEYQRTGAKWNEVVDNINWYHVNMPHNHMFNINCVWSYLNLFYLDELDDWHKNSFFTNRFGDPCNLIFQKAIGKFAVTHLSPSTINMLQGKFENKNNLKLLLNDVEQNNRPHTNFWRSIEQIDQIRQTDFRTLCPEWSAYL